MHCLVARTLAVLGGLLLIVGVIKPWMEVPEGFVTKPDGKIVCKTAQPRSAIPFRVICGGFAIVMGFGHLWHRRTSDRKAMLASTMITIQFFFPCVVMAWEPELSARANWLHIQHENLTWLGGDLCTNLEYSRKSWKDAVYLVDTPRQVNVVRMPASGLAAFQFGRLAVWFEALGYSNRYCQFIRQGWVAALMGMAFLIMGECLPGGRLNRCRVIRATAAAAVTFTIGALAVSVPIVIAARELELARTHTARGSYDAAENHLHRAAKALPALREDTFYVAQTGLLDYRLGHIQTPAGRLFRANLLERQGRYAQSMELYTALVNESSKGGVVHREAVRAILREAGHALNGGKQLNAALLFELVLREEPCNLKANYGLQLAYMRTERRDELARLCRQIEAIYAYFQMPTKAIVLALSHENEMFASLRAHDAQATFADAIRTKKP